jgi:L-alanine-DL-glutamate epimerase-like enolase superfamily enzyme
MKITSVEAIPFRLPLRRDFRWAGLVETLGGFVLVRIRTDEGLVGYGEATPLPDWGGDFGRRSGETLSGVVSIIETVLGPCLIGLDPTAVTRARAAMDTLVVGANYAKCAVDMALHDLWGKSASLPLYKLLGGACRESVQVAHMIGLMDEAQAVAEALGAAEDGFTALQIKGGVDAERDVQLLRRLRQELGPAFNLRVDANQGYGDAKTARRIVARLAEAGADCVEQPTTGLRAMAEVTASTNLPIIADETCWDEHDALEVWSGRAADCLSIYLAKAGGIVGARKVAAIAEAARMPCDVNGSIESAVGNAANIHFAMASPSVTLASVIPVNAPTGLHPCRVGGNYYTDDICTEPFAVKDGRLLRLEAPGLGIDVDEAKLQRLRIG